MSGAGERPVWRGLALGAFLVLVGLATLAAFVAGEGRLGVMLGPMAGFLLLWGIWRLPLRVTLFGMMFFALAVDSPMERPHAGWWTPPWNTLAELFFNNLHQTLKVPFLRFSGLEFLVVYLVLILAVRRARRSRVDPPAPPTPRPLARALALSFLAVAGWWTYGLLGSGADLTQSIWQMRVLLVMPVVVALFAHALRGPADQVMMGRIVVAAALVKVAVGAYFYFAICRPAGQLPPYVTTHTDSVLFSLALTVCLATWWESPTRKNLAALALVGPVVLLGVVLNERRLAWVTLGAIVLTIVLVSPWNRAKRLLARGGVLCAPLLVAYAVVGWSSPSPLFKPVQVLRSVTASDTGSDQDSSTEFRDMENYNLVATVIPKPLFGHGFGHPYDEQVKLPDISRAMPFYRYLPHNTVLWLWTIGGAVGFSALWLYLLVGVFLAARAYHHSISPLDRASMLVALCSVVAYLNQAFGDMGVQAYGCVFTVAPAMALAGTLATRVGAWHVQRARVPDGLPAAAEAAR